MRKVWIGVAIAAVMGAACARVAEEIAGDRAESADERPAGMVEPNAFTQSASPGGTETLDEVEAPEDDEAGGGSSLPSVGPRIIKDAEVAVEVERGGFKGALREVTAVAEAAGGFVLSSSVEGEEARRGTIVLRVPSERFEAAMNSIRDLGTVERERISGEDVSQEFVDLEARLRNLTAQEAVLLRLMDRARTVRDTIRVQRELTGVQLEVEQIRGRLRFLEDRTSLGTITATVSEEGAAAESPGIIRQAWERAVGAFLGVIGGLIAALGVVVPVGALLLLAWVAVRRLLPVARRASG